jgi:hypothetical protein
MSRYKRAIRDFRMRYLLGVVLRCDGSFSRAAAHAGIDVLYLRRILREHGIGRAQIREMLVNRELLRQGLPPRKPARSVSVSASANVSARRAA